MYSICTALEFIAWVTGVQGLNQLSVRPSIRPFLVRGLVAASNRAQTQATAQPKEARPGG